MKAPVLPCAGGDMMATIFDAIDHADFGKVWQLVQSKTQLNIVDQDSGLTPLALAAELGLTEIVRTLLEAGADPNFGGGTSPLESSVLEGDPEIVKMLLNNGADVNKRVGEGFTPLMTAAVAGDFEIARILLEAGAAPRAKNDDSHTAIDLAFANGHDELAKELRAFSRKRFEEDRAEQERQAQLEKEAQLEQRRKERQSRVAEAKARRAMEQAEQEKDQPPAPEEIAPEPEAEAPPPETQTAPEARPPQHREPKHREPKRREPKRPEPRRPEPKRPQPKKEVDELNILADLEAPRNAADAAAAFDALFGSIDRGLAGPDPHSAEGMEKFKAFLETTPEGARRMVLLDEISATETDAEGRTPLMWAAQFGAAETVQALLEAGAEVDLEDRSEARETALVKAINNASADRLEVISRLVQAGADLEKRHGETGMTPLMFAATADVYVPDPHSKIFGGTTRHLIKLGANLEGTDHDGNTVSELIKRNATSAMRSSPFRRRLFDMLKVLESAGARQ